MLAAEPDDLAGDQHHFKAQDIVGGEPIFQAMHPAGIFRHIAANGAGDLRGGIRRVVKALVLHRLGYGEVGDPRLHHGAAVLIVDFQHPVEFRKPQHNAVGQRQGPAGKRGASTARHDLDPVFEGIAQHFRHFRRGFRQHDHKRHLPVGGEPIGLINAHFLARFDHPFARNNPAQRRCNRGALS